MKSRITLSACAAVITAVASLSSASAGALEATSTLSQSSIVINAVLYDPSGDNAGNQKVELANLGAQAEEIGGWWFCYRFSYASLPANVTLEPGAFLVVHVGASGTNTPTDIFLPTASTMNAASSDLGLYLDGDFGNPSSMVDFVQWGGGGIGREGVAEDAEIWTAGDFVPLVAEGHSIEYDGVGDSSGDWADQPEPTLGEPNGNVTGVSNEQKERAFPRSFALMPNYPNPFNPSTTIRYRLPNAAEMRLTVHNVLGQEVAVLAEGRQVVGEHEVTWNASGIASGVYFVRLVVKSGSLTERLVETKKLVLLR